MFVVGLQRNNAKLYLISLAPIRWGERQKAMRFHERHEARLATAALKMTGTWSIEELEPAETPRMRAKPPPTHP